MKEKKDSWKKIKKEDEFLDLSDYARSPALKIVDWLAKTRVSSLHVTFTYFFVGILAAFLFATGDYGDAVLAVICLQIKNLLDAVDGSLARAKDQKSQLGRFLDSIFDFFINLFVYLAIVYALIWKFEVSLVIPLGLAALLSATLQCSFFNYYMVIYRRLKCGDATSRIDESDSMSERSASPLLSFCHKIYLLIYGWQDLWMMKLDGFSHLLNPKTVRLTKTNEKLLHQTYLHKTFLTCVTALGLGTQLLLITIFALLNQLILYFWLIVVVGNLYWLGLIVYTHLSRRKFQISNNK